MAAITILSDFRAQEGQVWHYSTFSPSICLEIMGPNAIILGFLVFSFKLALSLSSFTLIKRLFRFLFSFCHYSGIICISEVGVLPSVLIPAWNSSSLAFLMMCSVYRLNKWSDGRQPCHTPFSVLNQSVVPYRVLTVASWPAYRFLRRQVRCSGIPITLRAFHTLLWSKDFGTVIETEVYVFLEFPGFLCDLVNVDNLISGSSSFSKTQLGHLEVLGSQNAED